MGPRDEKEGDARSSIPNPSGNFGMSSSSGASSSLGRARGLGGAACSSRRAGAGASDEAEAAEFACMVRLRFCAGRRYGHVAQERQHAALGWSLLRKSQDEDIKALKHTLSLRRASMASAESSEGLANRHHRQQRPAPARPQQEWQAAKFRRVRYRCLKHFLLQ